MVSSYCCSGDLAARDAVVAGKLDETFLFSLLGRGGRGPFECFAHDTGKVDALIDLTDRQSILLFCIAIQTEICLGRILYKLCPLFFQLFDPFGCIADYLVHVIALGNVTCR